MGSGLILIWFLIALIYLFFHEKRKHMRIFFIYVPLMILLLFFNPLFYKLFLLTVGGEIYFRLCWLMPIIITLAYTIILICENMQGLKKTLFVLASVLLIVISGKPVYSSSLYSRAENIYHVPQAVVDICDAIEVEGREVMAAFPVEFLLYVRQYSPVVCMPYGRDVIFGYYNELCDTIQSREIDVPKLAALAKQTYCHYVILEADKPLLGNMEDYGYELFDTMHGYVIYRDTSMNFDV